MIGKSADKGMVKPIVENEPHGNHRVDVWLIFLTAFCHGMTESSNSKALWVLELAREVELDVLEVLLCHL